MSLNTLAFTPLANTVSCWNTKDKKHILGIQAHKNKLICKRTRKLVEKPRKISIFRLTEA